MHELSIAREVLSIIEAERRNRGFSAVSAVRVRAGALSGLDPVALEQAWEIVREGTFAAGSRLELDVDEGALICRACGERTGAERMPTECPACGSLDLRFEGATGLDVVSLEVS